MSRLIFVTVALATVLGGCRQLLGLEDLVLASSDAGVSTDADVSTDAGVDASVQVLPVNLGTAGDYAILAKTGISGPGAAVTGDLGVSPIASSSITGFSLIADASNTFSTSAQVTGKVFAADHATPTPARLTMAVNDMQNAFSEAAARTPEVFELAAGNIGGMILDPRVYRWSTGLMIQSNVTLRGTATDVWIFQIAKDLTMSGATTIVLVDGARPENVFWQVDGSVTLGAMAHLEGVVLTRTSVTFAVAALIKGRLLAQTAVSIDNSTVIQPSP